MQRKSISCLKIGKLFATKNARSMSGLSSLPLKSPPFFLPKSVRTRRAGLLLRYNQFYSPPGAGGKLFPIQKFSKSLRSKAGLLLTIIFW